MPSTESTFTRLGAQWLTAVAAASLLATSAHAATARPNILLIVADDLGFSDIGAFGGEIDTPNLDALAREGLRLTDFHSGATCSPTRSMLLSGVDHHLAGIGSMAELTVPEQQGKPGYEGYLNDRVVPFPQLLRQAGYHTLMAGKWHLGLTEERSPAARGFEKSFALLRGADDHVAQPWNTRIDPAQPLYREDGRLTTVPADFYSSNFYADKLVSYLQATQGDGKPFFAYLTLTAPHWPLQAPADAIAKYEHRYEAGYDALRAERIARQKSLGILPKDFQPAPALNVFPNWGKLTVAQQKQEARRMAVYAAMVDVMDQNIGKVIRQLKASGQYDNTLIVFISDNGAEGANVADRASAIPRDNRLANIGKASSYVSYGPNWAQIGALPYSLFKGYSREGGTTVPTIVRYPSALAKGKQPRGAVGGVSRVPGHVTDIAPTLLQLAGVAYPEKLGQQPAPALQGRSLLPVLSGQVTELSERFDKGWELFGQKAYRQGDWKVVYSVPPFGTGDWQLYNLKNDRAEQRDLAAQHPEKLAELKAAYAAYVHRNGVQEVPRLAERIAERYSSLNYFQALTAADAVAP
ncbi:arylsulfatase [Aquabacterium commune]|uniref:Arylsulfatase n=1 Tax=Aquabacterium commune TaxID=70586 RepID=A0A4R6RQ75_9BURK|nr:arylsulfatase [Aquabacterium commune]TDP88026.1 arylsulfatase [Aquabacterium commune]